MIHELLQKASKKSKFSNLMYLIIVQKFFVFSCPPEMPTKLSAFYQKKKVLNTEKKFQSHSCLPKVHLNVTEIFKVA